MLCASFEKETGLNLSHKYTADHCHISVWRLDHYIAGTTSSCMFGMGRQASVSFLLIGLELPHSIALNCIAIERCVPSTVLTIHYVQLVGTYDCSKLWVHPVSC